MLSKQLLIPGVWIYDTLGNKFATENDNKGYFMKRSSKHFSIKHFPFYAFAFKIPYTLSGFFGVPVHER